MTKKTFVDEELAREGCLKKYGTESKLSIMLQKARKIVSPEQESVAKAIEEALAANKYGLVLTPNETRELYGYSTIDLMTTIITNHLKGE